MCAPAQLDDDGAKESGRSVPAATAQNDSPPPQSRLSDGLKTDREVDGTRLGREMSQMSQLDLTVGDVDDMIERLSQGK